MKRKLLTFVIAAMAVIACALGAVACIDDVSSANGTYYQYDVQFDESGNISYGVLIKDHGASVTVVLKDGKATVHGQSFEYTMDGEDIKYKPITEASGGPSNFTYKKKADGVYLYKADGSHSICLVRDDVTPPFEVRE